jgi:CRP-like cAMP-binding protein
MTPAILKSVALFKGIAAADLERMLACIGTETASPRKGKIILLAGDRPRHVGIVLTGQLHIFRENCDGSRSLLAAMPPGEIFAETMCCAGVAKSPMTVTAAADSTIMLLDFSRILHTCPNSCPFHTRLIVNMLRLVAGKNIMLQRRMEIISLKSVRAKVMRYLESHVPKQGRDITIPFNREELANFLCVERSALSHELARMKKDGLIEYRKNFFRLC